MELSKFLVVLQMNSTLQILSVLFTIFSRTVSAWLFTRSSKPLAIDGGWSQWTNWSLCHRNVETNADFYKPWEGVLLASRKRNCNYPRPVNGGNYCIGNQYRYKQCGCQNPLGVENGRVRNTQLSASRALKDFPASNGRFGGKSAWCALQPASPFDKTYFQIDFKRFSRVTEIATEGIRGGRVSLSQVEYNIGANEPWSPYNDTGRKLTVLQETTLRRGVRVVRLKTPFIAQSLRLYPVNSIGRVCMKTEVFGCEFTCGQLLTTPTGIIVGTSSVNFDQDCLWRVKIPNATVINVYFELFNLPCKNANIEVRDVSMPFSDAEVKQRFCGENEAESYSFYGSDLWIRFRSNSHLDEVGFSLKYNSSCEREIQLPLNGNDVLMSPKFPDNYTYDCKWKITTAKQSMIQIEFLDFNIHEDSVNMSCDNNFLAISEPGKLTRKYCNVHQPNRTLFINDSSVIISFKTVKSVQSSSFKIKLLSYGMQNEVENSDGLITKSSAASSHHESITRTEPCTLSRDRDRVLSNKSTETPDKSTVIIIVVSCSIVVFLVILVVIGGKNIYNVHVQETFSPVGNWDIKHVMVKRR